MQILINNFEVYIDMIKNLTWMYFSQILHWYLLLHINQNIVETFNDTVEAGLMS